MNAQTHAKYEVLRVVSRGGMGEIALGRVRGSKGFDKLVVLKCLRSDAERDDHRLMFDVEAELMSRIEHPNIVQVFDQPIIDGTPYLAMAYVRGRNLDQYTRKMKGDGARVAPLFAYSVISEVLRGLAFIHRLKDDNGDALGVVHQDITPSNILVSFFGEVKITDFGIAYVTSRDGGRRGGVLKGKPRYIAPEILAGRRANNRVDIYGVGLVLYEMLKGHALFARPKVQDTLAAVAKSELPSFATDLPHVSAGVHALLRRALAKDPADRYRTAEEMAHALAPELAEFGGPMSAVRMGSLLRERFKGERDVPESDVDVDDGSLSIFMPAFRSPGLEQTLSELDRLLGAESSSDLFALPPEIADELADIADMEPFEALTPLPELALSGPGAEDRLLATFDGPPTRPSSAAASRPEFSAQSIDEWTDPALTPPALLRRTRPPAPRDDDSSPPAGAAPDDNAERSGSRRTSVIGSPSTGEYSFASPRARRKRSLGSGDDTHLSISDDLANEPTVISTPPMAVAASDVATSPSLPPLPAAADDGRSGYFIMGLVAGIILGALAGASIVFKLLG